MKKLYLLTLSVFGLFNPLNSESKAVYTGSMETEPPTYEEAMSDDYSVMKPSYSSKENKEILDSSASYAPPAYSEATSAETTGTQAKQTKSNKPATRTERRRMTYRSGPRSGSTYTRNVTVPN